MPRIRDGDVDLAPRFEETRQPAQRRPWVVEVLENVVAQDRVESSVVPTQVFGDRAMDDLVVPLAGDGRKRRVDLDSRQVRRA